MHLLFIRIPNGVMPYTWINITAMDLIEKMIEFVDKVQFQFSFFKYYAVQ